jgi:probable HAF family extracellular repeat protein
MFKTSKSCKPSLRRVFMMFLLSCLLVPCLVAAGLAQTQPYTIIDLGTLGGTSTVAWGINASGQVVGVANLSGDTAHHAFRTAANSPINPSTDDLGTLGGASSTARKINASGQVVGVADRNDGTSHAFRTAPNSAINPATDDLGTLGGAFSEALGINASGEVVGWSARAGNAPAHAYRTVANGPINQNTDDLGTLGGSSSGAYGINDSGQVVGEADTTGGTYHAFRTAPDIAINPATDDLGTLGGNYSWAYGINASGQVVGVADRNDGTSHAFRTAANRPINPATDDLGTLGGTYSEAHGINACGQVVGNADISGGAYHAFVYTGGAMQDLNNLIPSGSGWVLGYATAINDSGQITGYGTHGVGAQHAFLLTPTQGAFVCTGHMRTPRMNHTATLLSGGNTVLITGGAGSPPGTRASAETYDVAAGGFTYTNGDMISPRQLHTATLLDSGQVLIAGGYNSPNSWLNSAELYDPVTRTFASTGSMTDARQWHTATLLNNGQVLITGGWNGQSTLSSAELYVAGGTFSPAASMNLPRYGHAATLLGNGQVLITGGCGTGGSPDCTRSAEVYDPESNTFTPTGDMVQPHAWHTATLLSDGTVLIAGGVQGTITVNCAEIYHPTTGTFTTTGAMVGQNSYYHTATILFDGSVLIAGGEWTNPLGVTNQAQLYSGGTFSLVTGTMSDTRRYHTATGLGNGLVLIAGGEDASNTVLSSADLYQAPESITQPLSSDGGTASFIFNNNLYNIVFQYPAGLVPDDSYSLTVTPIQTSQADWALRTPDGNPYAGTQLAPVNGLGGDGIIYRAVCADAAGNPCPAPPADLSYTTVTSWDGPAGDNPGFLKATIGTNEWENVLISYSSTRLDAPDPTASGKSGGGFSDWALVYNVTGTAPTIQITTPANGASYTLNQVVNAGYTCVGASVKDCLGTVPNGGAVDTSSLGNKTFTVNATVKEGPTAVQTVSYTVVEACHYAWFTLNPSTVPLGGSTKVTANLHSCSNVSQKVSLQFAWTVPAPGSCSSNKTVILTTPPFLLKPKTSISLTFPVWIPKKICTGTYTVSASTLIDGVVVDTTSSSLTVTSN